MWPFRRQPRTVLPAWNLRPLVSESCELHYRVGEWVATDGGHAANSVVLGRFDGGEGTLKRHREEDELRVELRYHGEGAPSFHELVIDSGVIVLCCAEAFAAAAITNRATAQLLRACRLKHPRVEVVLIEDASGECVGLIVTPPLGDGVYQLKHSRHEGWHLLVIELDSESWRRRWDHRRRPCPPI